MSNIMETKGRDAVIGLTLGTLLAIWVVTAFIGQGLVLTPGNDVASTAWMFPVSILVAGALGSFAFWRLGSTGQALAGAALVIAILSVVYVALAALGSKWGWWNFSNGFAMLLGPWGKRVMFGAVGVGTAALIIGLVTPGRVRPVLLALPAAFIAIRLISTIAGQGTLAGSVPPIHDIQTNWADPVHFSSALMELRGEDSNPVRYGADAVFRNPGSAQFGGKLIADIQEAAECPSHDDETCEDGETLRPYRPLDTVILAASPAAVFEASLRIVDQSGWTLVTSQQDDGVIEATNISPWWGFKDDVAIRIRATDTGGSAIDMRSISRVGGSDLGANERRVTQFLYDLKGQSF